MAPVERICRGVAEIGGGDMSKRVPPPVARDEVPDLAKTMNSMLDRLEASTGRQQRLIADASPEGRSPRANMQAFLAVALHDCCCCCTRSDARPGTDQAT